MVSLDSLYNAIVILASQLISQLSQQIQNCLARTVVKAPKSSHIVELAFCQALINEYCIVLYCITPILRSLHWLQINERIEYKLLSLTYKVLTTNQPDYLHNLIYVQSSGRTRSSSVVTLARPSVRRSIFLITNHQPLFQLCITSVVESALFFIPSTSFCSLSSWFTSSCAYHLITVTSFALTIYHSLDLSLKT